MDSLSRNILLVLLSFSALFSKSFQKKVLALLLGTLICTGRGHSETYASGSLSYAKKSSRNLDANTKTLTVPEVEEGVPEAGKRVKIYLPEYPEAYYVLFLPYNFKETMSYPVICEIPANGCSKLYNGLPETTTFLGYGITKGMDWIWVSLPVLNSKGTEILKHCYPDDPLPTTKFYSSVLKDLEKRFIINTRKIILSGFSKGAVMTSYLGNSDDLIASKWAAYFTYAHFDGCCQAIPGNADERIQRINGKKVLIAVGEHDIAQQCSRNAYLKLKNQGFPVTYIEHPDIYTDKWENLAHNPFWILEDSEAAEEARNWLRNLFTED